MTNANHAFSAEEQEAERQFRNEARRVLRRLCEAGAVLAVAEGLEKAVVVRETPSGTTQRTAVVDAELAEGMALRDWVSCKNPGRICRYRVTAAGRTALNRMLAEEANAAGGFGEAAMPFADQHRPRPDGQEASEGKPRRRRARYNLAESPLTLLARRRDRNGERFLSDDLVAAGERLREDFELAQIGARVTQNWERFLTGSQRGTFGPGSGSGSEAARERVARALAELGPGLGDVALRCCCHLEGLETAERNMGWSARSGKIVLRIALQRLKRHYDEVHGPHGPLIG